MSLTQPASGTVTGGNRYKHVRVLLLSWEQINTDSPKVQQQLKSMYRQLSQLRGVFQQCYSFAIDEWRIPRDASYRRLGRKLLEFEETYNTPDHLLIIYYAGHGAVSADKKAIWKCYNGEGSPEVDWFSLQATFLNEYTKADILMLIDCCRAGSAIVYVLAASGFDSDAPLDGPNTFTANMVAELAPYETYSRGVKVTILAAKILSRLSSILLPDGSTGASSIHYPLRDPQEDRIIRLIRHTPLDREENRLSVTPTTDSNVGTKKSSASRGSSSAFASDYNHADMQAYPYQAVPRPVSERPSAGIPLGKSREQQRLIKGGKTLESSHTQKPSSTSTRAVSLDQVREKLLISDDVRHFPNVAPNDHDVTLLRSLFYPEMQRRVDTDQSAYAGTTQWVFEQEDFRSWLKCGNGTFWIRGKAGSGKSTLMKVLVESEQMLEALSECAGPNNIDIVSFFFRGSGSAVERSLSGMLRSLLFQILERNHSFLAVTRKLVGVPEQSNFHDFWDERKLRDAFRTVLREYSSKARQLCLFVDGLDQHESHSIQLMESVQQWARGKTIKACISSRHVAGIEKAWTGYPPINMEDWSQSAITSFLVAELSSGSLKQYLSTTTNTKQVTNIAGQISTIAHEIAGRSQGVYFWVHLIVRSMKQGLASGNTLANVLLPLLNLPTDIESIYAAMLKQLSIEEQRTASKIIQTLRASETMLVEDVSGIIFEPLLTTVALHFALAKDQDQLIDTGIRTLDRAATLAIDERVSTTLESSTVELPRAEDWSLTRKLGASSSSSNANFICSICGTWKKHGDHAACAPSVDATTGSKHGRWTADEDDLFETLQKFSPERHALSKRRPLAQTASLLQIEQRNDLPATEQKLGRQIGYMHQSVRGFFEEPSISAKLHQLTAGSNFDPNLDLLGSIVLQIGALDFGIRNGHVKDTVHELACWSLVDQALSYAARVRSRHELMVRYLDELDKTMTMKMKQWKADSSFGHWSEYLPLGRPKLENWHDSFLSLAITYSVLPYITSKLLGNPKSLPTKKGRPFLDYALLPGASHKVEPKVVALLLQHGAPPNQRFAGNSVWGRFLRAYNKEYFSGKKISDKTERLRKVHDLLLRNGADRMVADQAASHHVRFFSQ